MTPTREACRAWLKGWKVYYGKFSVYLWKKKRGGKIVEHRVNYYEFKNMTFAKAYRRLGGPV
jgi:hypothetical protein